VDIAYGEEDFDETTHRLAKRICVTVAGFGESQASRTWLRFQCFLLCIGCLSALKRVVELLFGSNDLSLLQPAKVFGYAACDIFSIIALVEGRKAYRLVACKLPENKAWGTRILAMTSCIFTLVQTADFLAWRQAAAIELSIHNIESFVGWIAVILTTPGFICAFVPVCAAHDAALGMLADLLREMQKETSGLDWHGEMPLLYGDVGSKVDKLCADMSSSLLSFLVAFGTVIIAKSIGLWGNSYRGSQTWEVVHTTLTTCYFVIFVGMVQVLTRVSAHSVRIRQKMIYHLPQTRDREEVACVLRMNSYIVENPICWKIYISRSSVIRIKGSSSVWATAFVFGNAAVRILSAVGEGDT